MSTPYIAAGAFFDGPYRYELWRHWRRALIPTAWDDLSERVKLGWRDDVLPLVTAAAPFVAAQAAEAERGWWVRAVEQIWLGLGPTGRCESGQPLLDLLALDKRRGGE